MNLYIQRIIRQIIPRNAVMSSIILKFIDGMSVYVLISWYLVIKLCIF